MAYSQYNKQTWADLPSTSTPLSAARLQYIEDAVAAASTQVIALSGQVASLAAGTGGTAGTGDTTAPTINSFTATPSGSGSVTLAWTASDNVAVTRCTVSRSGTTRYDGNARTFTETGLTNGTSYNWTLTVYDAAGNTKTATATATPASGTTAPTSDTTAPTVPTLTLTGGTSGNPVTLTWTASTDNVAVAGYRVVRNGTQLATGITGTSYTDTTTAPATSYTYTVQAYDAAGNSSAASTARSVTTAAAPDTTAPTVPTGLTIGQITSTTANLAWAASSDAGGVATYDVYVNGSKTASAPGGANPFYVVTGLSPATAYTFRVAAVDLSGNTSGLSTSATATTLAASTGTVSTLAAPTFPGTSGAALPSQWTTLTGSGGTVTQDGAGRARFVSSATPYTTGNWALLSSVTAKGDLDVTLDVTFPVIAEEYLSIELRATAPASATSTPTNSYFVAIYPGNGANSMGVSVRSGGNETSLSGDIAAGAWTANTARRVRFQAVGNTVAVKVWAPGSTEPTAWVWSATNTVIAGATGSLLLTMSSGAAATARTALISNITLSTGTTAAGVSNGGGAGAGGNTGSGTVTSTMPTGDLTGWKYVSGQDFTTDAALGKVGSVYGQDLRGYDTFYDTSQNGLYAPDKVLTVSNSALNVRLHTENGQALVACPIPFGYTGQLYGRYSTRLRVDSGSGYKIAFLLWSATDNWNDGEIDFPEMDLSAGSTIGGYSHNTTGNPSANAWSMDTNVTLADWHVCTIEWTPTKLTYLVDGVAQSTTAAAAIPKKAMRWTLQCETQLDGGAPPASSVATVYVDWCAQWSYAP